MVLESSFGGQTAHQHYAASRTGSALGLTRHRPCRPRTCCVASRPGLDGPSTDWQRPKGRSERDVSVSVAANILPLARLERPARLQGHGRDQPAGRLEVSGSSAESSQSPLSTSVQRAVKQQQASRPLLLKFCSSGAEELRLLSTGLNFAALGLGVAVAAGKAMQVGAAFWPESLVWHTLSETIGQTWQLYDSTVEGHPLSVKAAISGVVYALGDLTAQSYEGRSLAECDSARILRSALCGFLAHGPLAHTYYQAVDRYFTISPLFTDAWFVPMIKIALDQTVWALTWNSLYYATLGMMKLESPSVIGSTLSQSWWGCLRAGWRMWPIAHLVTYTVIPTQHKLLWVDMCELAWVTVLSYYGQQQRALAVAAVAAAGGADAWEGAPVTQVACALPNTGNFADEILRGMQVERSGICFEDEEGDVLCRPIEEVYAEAAIAEVHGMAALSKVPIDSGDHNLTGLPR